MADVDNQTALAATTTPASSAAPQGHTKKEKKTKNPRIKPSHPPTAEMVNNAIKGLKERGGSSLQAIKKFIAANYKVDAEKVAPFIKKYLKGAVASGGLVQTKGKGASGSFKLASSTAAGARASAGEKKKTSSGTKSKKSSSKRAAATPASGEKAVGGKVSKKTTAAASSPKAKKTAAERKSAAAAKSKKAAAAAEKKAASGVGKVVSKTKSPSKAKKSNKPGPTKKPKAPKPKSAKAIPAKAKKAASPKRKK